MVRDARAQPRAGSFMPKTRWLQYAENLMAPMCRKMTLGGVSYLVAGSDAGRETAARLYSLMGPTGSIVSILMLTCVTCSRVSASIRSGASRMRLPWRVALQAHRLAQSNAALPAHADAGATARGTAAHKTRAVAAAVLVPGTFTLPKLHLALQWVSDRLAEQPSARI